MTTRIAPMAFFRTLAMLLASLVLAACGGGGGGGITATPSQNVLTITPVAPATLPLAVSYDGTTYTNASLTLTLKNADGNPVAGTVYLSAPSTVTVPSSVVIPSSGTATVTVQAKTSTPAGTVDKILTTYTDTTGTSNGPTIEVVSSVATGTGGGTTPPSAALPTLSGIVFDSGAQGNILNAAPAMVHVTLMSGGTTPAAMPNQIVTYSISGSGGCSGGVCGQLNPVTGSVLTDTSGEAKIALQTSPTAFGAATLTATYTSVGGQNISTSTNFYTSEKATSGATPSTTAALSTITLDHGNSTTDPIKNGTDGHASVTLTNCGATCANKVVSFSAGAGVLSPVTGKVLTDNSGVATITLSAGTINTAATLTATYSDSNGTVSSSTGFYTLGDAPVGTGGAGASMGAITFSPTNHVDASAAPTTASVTLSGCIPNCANQVVAFTATAGSLLPTSGLVLTNSGGVATVILKDGSAATAGYLRASYTDASGNTAASQAGFDIAGNASTTTANKPTIVVTPDGASVSATATTFTIKALKADGTTPLINTVILVTSTAGVLDPSTGMVMTNNLGQATVTLKDGGVATAGILTATLSSDASVSGQVAFQTDGTGTTNAQPKLTVAFAATDPGDNQITGTSDGVATITVVNAGGTALTNAVVQVTSTAGVLVPASGLVLTNSSGVATVTLKDGGVATAGTLTATLTSNAAVTGSATFTMDGTGTGASSAAPKLLIAWSNASPHNGNQISKTAPGQATITLTKADGFTAIPNQVVKVTTTGGALDPSSGMVLTDTNGVATINLSDAGVKTAGLLTATFTNSDGTATAQSGFSLAGDGSSSPATLSVPALTNAGTAIGTAAAPITQAQPATVDVTLLNASGVAIQNAVVNFSLSSAVGSLSQSSALTDSTGHATVTLNVGSTQGAGTLTASYTDASNNTVTSQTSFAVQISAGSGLPTLSTPTLLDGSNTQVGTTANPITTTNPATVSVTLKDSSNNPLTNKLISFSLTGGVGALDPSVGTALTDGAGKASIALNAGATEGAGTLTASYTDGVTATTVTSQADFTTKGAGVVTAQTLALGSGTGVGFSSGNITPPASPVSGSSQSVSVNVVDTTGGANTLYTSAPIAVTFTSQCAQSGLASFNPATANTIGGTALTSYKPQNGCSNDTISASASVNGSTLTATTGSFTVTQSPANSISFVSASPAIIGVKGSSAAGAQETSVLTFQVKDQNGTPVGAGTNVDFVVQTQAGGFVIAGSTTGATDASGDVSVTVNSGSVPMVGTIKAALTSDASIYGTGSVSIQQGVATEDRFVIAVATLNPAAGNHVGVTDQVTVRAADRYGNWVPDGTIVNFATKLGDIQPSCTIASGTCSVTWTSAGPQPLLFDANRKTDGCAGYSTEDWYRHGLPPQIWNMGCNKHDRYGVNVITAWATGEESFSDTNGNNVFDSGEPFISLGEAFDDNNINGNWDAVVGSFSEDFQDLNSNGTYDGPTSSDYTPYRGLSCSAASITAGDCKAQLINVRRATTMVLSTDDIQLGVWNSALPGDLDSNNPSAWGDGAFTSVTGQATQATGTVAVAVADANGNAPPAGTTVSISALAVTGAAVQPQIVGPTSCAVANATGPLECDFNLVPGTTGNKFTITATSGAGSSIVKSVVLVAP